MSKTSKLNNLLYAQHIFISFPFVTAYLQRRFPRELEVTFRKAISAKCSDECKLAKRKNTSSNSGATNAASTIPSDFGRRAVDPSLNHDSNDEENSQHRSDYD